MKKAILLILLLLPVLAVCQKFKSTSELPVRNSDVIIVKSTLPDEDVFKIAGRQLIKDGYKIDKSDDTFLSISTRMEPKEGWSFSFTINISIIDGQAIVRGDLVNGNYGLKPYYGKGSKAWAPSIAFQFMSDYAKNLSGQIAESSIVYAVEN